MDTSSLSHPVLSGLVRKRQEIAAAIEAHQSALHGLVRDIDALDATIRLFSPELDIETVRVRPTPRRHGVQPGDTSKLVLSLIREGGPMTQRQITLAVMEHRGLNVADAVLRGVMRNRVGASLRGLGKRGTLIRETGGGKGVRWEVSGPACV